MPTAVSAVSRDGSVRVWSVRHELYDRSCSDSAPPSVCSKTVCTVRRTNVPRLRTATLMPDGSVRHLACVRWLVLSQD